MVTEKHERLLELFEKNDNRPMKLREPEQKTWHHKRRSVFDCKKSSRRFRRRDLGSASRWIKIHPDLPPVESSGRPEDRDDRQRIVYVRSNHTLVLQFRYDYDIDLNWIRSESQLLRWVLHLSEKTGINSRHRHHFILAVADIKNFRVHGL
jgi:hypothetical protein